MKREYDTTIARIAGDIAAGLAANGNPMEDIAAEAVTLARAIVARVKATEPAADPSVPRLAICDPAQYPEDAGR